MTLIIVGIVYGAICGQIGNLLLFRKLEQNRQAGVEPLRGIGLVFFLRYFLDAVCLVIFYLMTLDALALVAATLSVTVAVKISLFVVYTRKGGRFD